MRCPECDTENPSDARFCFKCGSKFALNCSDCGAAVLLEAQFCSQCGARVAQAAPPPPPSDQDPAYLEALQRLVPREFAERLRATRGQAGHERRTVTILFSDVKGSTAMAEDLDPEDVMDIMAGAFEVLIPPIYRHEGTVARLMGDAILAFFGAPIAHEDDPERAVRAALEIVAGAQDYAARLEEARGISGFNVRVGINTGLVVVGEVGSDLRVEYTAMGDAINLAARMEQHAPVGNILITHETYRHVRGVFDVAPQEPLRVKGKAEPVQTYLVQREKPRAFRVSTRGVEGIETSFVGRGPELHAVQETWRDVVEDAETQVVTVVGGAGVGKSRLLGEFSNWIKLGPEGVWYFRGQAAAATQGVPNSLWRDLFANRFDILDSDDTEATLAKFRAGMAPILGPAQADLVGHLVGFDLSASKSVRDSLDNLDFAQTATASLSDYLRGLLSQAPTLMLLEDLHWADDSSLDLLTHLVAGISEARLLVVGAARPALYDRRPSWGEGLEAYTRLDLRPLSRRASRALVTQILSRVPDLPNDLQDLIVDGAEGNPFFVEELIKVLIEDGVIVTEDKAWNVALDRFADVRVPSSLTAVLQARLDHLPFAERALLQRASVVGKEFWDQLIEELSADALAADEVPPLLGSLRSREMVYRREQSAFDGAEEYVFRHAVIRDVAYETVLRKLRRRYHAQIAAWLEDHAGERLAEYLGLIAGHYERSGNAERATDFLLRAGDRARSVGALKEAIASYERAVAILRKSGDLDRAARSLMKLGLTYHNAFRFDEAHLAYEEGFELWRRAALRRPVQTHSAPHALRVARLGAVTLDPAFATDGGSMEAIGQLFSGLVTTGPGMNIEPDVAHSWEVLDGGSRYVFHLRNDVTWSDGHPVTASDFEYAWRRLLDPGTQSPNARFVADVRGADDLSADRMTGAGDLGVHAVDDVTLLVDLSQPTSYMLELVATPGSVAVPRHVVQKYGDDWTRPDNIVTSGPFRLVAQDRGRRLTLRHDPTYHGPRSGNVDDLVLWSDDSIHALVAYELGDCDIVDIGHFEVSLLQRVRQRHLDEYITPPQATTHFIAFDTTRPPFNHRRVRRALALAADRAALSRAVVLGLHLPATGGFVPPGVPGHTPGIGLPHDPDLARQELAEAGFPGGRGFPPVECLASDSARRQGVTSYLESVWREHLGVEVTWTHLPWDAQMRRVLSRVPNAWEMGWTADYVDPDNFLRIASWIQRGGWQSREYSGLLAQARRTLDHEQRIAVYRRADRILVEEAPIIPLFYARAHFLVKPWVQMPAPTLVPHYADYVLEPH